MKKNSMYDKLIKGGNKWKTLKVKLRNRVK